MVEYKDPIPHVLGLLIPSFKDVSIYGNNFPSRISYPSVLIRQAGGNGFYRLQLLARSTDDIQAMSALIEVRNYLVQFAKHITGLRVLDCVGESNPIPDRDEDTGLFEAWCYVRLEAVETNSMG